MSRDHLALLALMLASVAAFLALRQPGPTEADAPAARARLRPSDSPEPVEVKELTLDDSGDRRSVRVLHPSREVQRHLHDWLEPREQQAVTTRSALACSAETATTRLVSVRCVSVAPPEHGRGVEPAPEYAAVTLRIDGDSFEELDLRAVLAPGIGEREVVEACRRFADPPLPCGWPPTAFAIVGGTSLFVCHGPSCVDIEEEESAPALLRRGLVTVPSRW